MHTVNLSVRAATSSDIPRLTELWQDKMTLQQQYDQRLRLMSDAGIQWSAALGEWLTDAAYAVFVIERDVQILGYVIGKVQATTPGVLPERVGMVTDIAFDAHSTQGGLGRTLLQPLREWFAAQGVEQIVAQVPRRSAVEQAFWRALGATEWMNVMWLK